jgi:HEPN domain-containing protein
MTEKEKINYWIKSSDIDFRAVNNLYNSGDYSWALFVGHLVIEKSLKGLYQKIKGEAAPYIHDLVRLAEYANLNLKEEQKSILDDITSFNIATRYSDQKFAFYKKATKDYAALYLDNIKEMREWMKELLIR